MCKGKLHWLLGCLEGSVAKNYKLIKIDNRIMVKTILNKKTGASFTPFPFRIIRSKLQFVELKFFCNTTLRHAKTERKAEIQPHCMAHYVRREAIAFVVGSNDVRFHEAILT